MTELLFPITILEYIWIGGKNEIRSKTRVMNLELSEYNTSLIPDWNYDGSSTWQANSNEDTEIILKPRAIFNDPFREDGKCRFRFYLVLCDTYKSSGEPTETNHRHNAVSLFDKLNEQEPWFGLEQEYFFSKHSKELCHSFDGDLIPEGYHYCGIAQNANERIIVEQHLQMCISAGIKISGINAEVSKGQWEFQIGPCEGIQAGDHLIVARYILERLAEKAGLFIIYQPKPRANINGSGCHINFSTVKTRNENGIVIIHNYIERLEKKHSQHIAVYGENNHSRLTGLHETSCIDKFSWGVGTRNTSIRIPNQTFRENRGYFEDRRPAANIDPYLATSIILNTCCLDTTD
jgi:glutamine synthetase